MENTLNSPKENKFTFSGNYLGRHILAEYFDCDPDILNNVQLIEENLVYAANKCGATVVNRCFHTFNPHGVSGVVVIAESHLAIHTWPEYSYASVDIFTCGDNCSPDIAYEILKSCLIANSSTYSELQRGHINRETSEMITAPFKLAREG